MMHNNGNLESDGQCPKHVLVSPTPPRHLVEVFLDSLSVISPDSKAEKITMAKDVLHGHLSKYPVARVFIAGQLVGEGMEHAVAISSHLNLLLPLRPQHCLNLFVDASLVLSLFLVRGKTVLVCLVEVPPFLSR